MSSKVRVEIPYGLEMVGFEVPSANLMGVYSPRATLPVADPSAEVARALEAPLDGPPLEQIARGARNVVLVADDLTRLTPTQVILPILLDRLNAAGVPDEAIQVIVALGTHRKMTRAEMALKFGREVVGRVPVSNHDAFDPAALEDLGATPSGVPVRVNRTVLEADLVLGIGSIVPHHIPGYSGGAKIIQPGVCGQRTTGEVHLLSVRRSGSLLGVVENEVRHEMEAIAERVGLRAVLNTVLNRDGELVSAFFGQPRTAFRRGVGLSRQVYGVTVPALADIVIAGSHPCDLEFWQAHKTLYAGELCVRDGGTIIVVTPCPEGVAVTHPDVLDLAGRPAEEIDAAIRRGQVRDLTGTALALAWASIRRRATVYLVSDGICPEDARALGFVPFGSVGEALGRALARHGEGALVSVLPYAPDTLPLVAHSPA